MPITIDHAFLWRPLQVSIQLSVTQKGTRRRFIVPIKIAQEMATTWTLSLLHSIKPNPITSVNPFLLPMRYILVVTTTIFQIRLYRMSIHPLLSLTARRFHHRNIRCPSSDMSPWIPNWIIQSPENETRNSSISSVKSS